ncbi:MAG TPA: magnesium chelatase ATPase subunit I, partial [Candidatus Cloacimonadota bacterium]|nr:magnesium chelatase ATPase subunit I [Candidatus Cloacimonadota bacterium]
MISYPFLGIIGQDEAVLAILLNLVDSSIGGVLLKGTKGTGKSTIVYGIPQVSPEIEVNSNCLYNCNPNDIDNLCLDCKNSTENTREQRKIQVVNIPMSISEENLFGKINIEHLIKKGESKFVPGVLAQANRNILYIDEVNLL